jgi:PIN domain nuclease of toxin-antitoxin system
MDCCTAGTAVLDPSYRSALKMETDAFVSNVNLHELGILADVKKLMVPHAHARIRAELYKLNMCAAPHVSHRMLLACMQQARVAEHDTTSIAMLSACAEGQWLLAATARATSSRCCPTLP